MHSTQPQHQRIALLLRKTILRPQPRTVQAKLTSERHPATSDASVCVTQARNPPTKWRRRHPTMPSRDRRKVLDGAIVGCSRMLGGAQRGTATSVGWELGLHCTLHLEMRRNVRLRGGTVWNCDQDYRNKITNYRITNWSVLQKILRSIKRSRLCGPVNGIYLYWFSIIINKIFHSNKTNIPVSV